MGDTDLRRFSLIVLVLALLGVIAPVQPVALPASAVTGCTSGSVTTNSSASPVIVVTFTAPASGNGSCTWTVPENVYSVDYLVVAGGGGGASGGGGGGGVVTSFATTNADNSTNAASTPLAVTPGEDLSVVVGAGGSAGAGGSPRYSGTASTEHTTDPANGANSSIGSVTAIGGGAGGHREYISNAWVGGIGSTGGSSGGDSFDRNSSGGATAAASSVVGAQSFGRDGGGSPGGSFSAGGGGGGAGAVGGNARQLTAGCGAENCTSNYHGGGHGGRGIRSAITGSLVEYGCGGGGGVNSNNNVVVTSGGGNGGCSTAGNGSRYGNLYTNYAANATTNAANATAGSAGFGGGGGGTDPEDYRAGAGGSGVVILRYTVVDANCPNDDSASISGPIACPSEVTVAADSVAVDKQMRGAPISFAGSSAALSVLTTPNANPTSGNMSVTVVNGDTFRITVPSGSSLIGGTYPVTYRITENSVTSDSYLLVTVEDPDVAVPEVLLVDPRGTTIELPAFLLGSSTNILLCIIQDADSHGDLTVSGASSSGVTVTNRTRGVSVAGTRTNVASAISGISIDKAAADDNLTPSGDDRTVKLTISNTDNGGNNSCSNGTVKTVVIRDLGLDKKHDYLFQLFER